MLSGRDIFLRHIAHTSDNPLMLEIEKAEGIFIFTPEGKKYIDLISGISVSNLGHRHPEIIDAIKKQLDKNLHLMVYGEYISSPQVRTAELLINNLPPSLDSVYFVNSGTEANEGALKLARKFSGRPEIVSFINAYHGGTFGSLSVMGSEGLKKPFRPLLPGISFINFNNSEDLDVISENTACVIVEPIQSEAGIVAPDVEYMRKLSKRCSDTGALLILDEIQTGFGRTGKLFAFEHFSIIPDILTIAKAFGGGMPLGAFVTSKKIMDTLKSNPPLSHLTTFGGHPVSCAAAYKSLEILTSSDLILQSNKKSKLFLDLLKHKAFKEVRGCGLHLAVEFGNSLLAANTISNCMEKGLITDYFLFCDTAIRISPPLTITEEEIRLSCSIILESVDEALKMI